MKEAGAHAVKLEGGAAVAPQVAALVGAGIPVMAHIGFTPQKEHALGGYRVQGRGAAADEVFADAVALQAAGAFAVVLEMVPADTAKRITGELMIPTIGIGAGVGCDGQILLCYDLLGVFTDFKPKFTKRYAKLTEVAVGGIRQYVKEVKEGAFPDDDHSYTVNEAEYEKFAAMVAKRRQV
jgi:3-methyl-2-oxobutanoate hydroxymethyltransferase